MRESRATHHQVFLWRLRYTRHYEYVQPTALVLHEQGSQRRECKCVRTGMFVVSWSQLVMLVYYDLGLVFLVLLILYKQKYEQSCDQTSLNLNTVKRSELLN